MNKGTKKTPEKKEDFVGGTDIETFSREDINFKRTLNIQLEACARFLNLGEYQRGLNSTIVLEALLKNRCDKSGKFEAGIKKIWKDFEIVKKKERDSLVRKFNPRGHYWDLRSSGFKQAHGTLQSEFLFVLATKRLGILIELMSDLNLLLEEETSEDVGS